MLLFPWSRILWRRSSCSRKSWVELELPSQLFIKFGQLHRWLMNIKGCVSIHVGWDSQPSSNRETSSEFSLCPLSLVKVKMILTPFTFAASWTLRIRSTKRCVQPSRAAWELYYCWKWGANVVDHIGWHRKLVLIPFHHTGSDPNKRHSTVPKSVDLKKP